MNLCRWILLGLCSITFMSCGISDWFGEDHEEYVPDGWQFLPISVATWRADHPTLTVFNNKIYFTQDTNYIYTSTDAGNSWEKWYNGSYLSVSLYSDSASLFISSDQGIYIMNKDETTPRQVSSKKNLKITASRDNYLFATTDAKEGWISSDRGVTWKQLLGGNTFKSEGQLFDGNYLYTAKYGPGGDYINRISLSDYTATNLSWNLNNAYIMGFTKVDTTIFVSTQQGIYYMTDKERWTGFWDESMSSSFFKYGSSIYAVSYYSFIFSLDSGATWKFHKKNSWYITAIFECGDYIIGYSYGAIYRKHKRDL